jgi:hypothetical protein
MDSFLGKVIFLNAGGNENKLAIYHLKKEKNKIIPKLFIYLKKEKEK